MFDLFPSGLCLPLPLLPHYSFPIVLFLKSFLLPVAVPGAPPRKLEVEAMNSTAIRVTWKPPLQSKQHGQIRGYQVTFSRLENGEPRGQPNILDIALPEAQVLDNVLLSPACSHSLSPLSLPLLFIPHYRHSALHLFPLHSPSSHFISLTPSDMRWNSPSAALAVTPLQPPPPPAPPSVPFLPFATSTFDSQSLPCPARRQIAESILILRLKKKRSHLIFHPRDTWMEIRGINVPISAAEL